MGTGYVTLDEWAYKEALYGPQPSDFSAEFDASFVQQPTPDGSLPPWGWANLTERPEHPPYSKLWPRFGYPQTPLGLLLWKDGTVKATGSFYDNDYLTCDDAILGGHLWIVPEDSWQAQVMRDAGYPLIECEPIP